MRARGRIKQLETGYVSVSEESLAVQELVVLVGHGRLHNKTSLWMRELHKIVLVGQNAPQNHSCGVLVPPQTCSCSGNGRKSETQMEMKMREIYIYFLFLMNLEQGYEI
jgi:hypothetical protein